MDAAGDLASAGSAGWPGTDASDSGSGGDAASDADSGPATASVSAIHERHRYHAGKMFGGWGPHLGHLVRAPASDGAGDTLWLVDDYCAQNAADGALCDVNHDHTLGYFELAAGGWIERHTIQLPGLIQQNTATLVGASGAELHTFGVDIGAGVIQECRYAPASGPLGCSTLPFTLGPSSNYIGAAVSPSGSRLVWWTGVVDGGGGSFHYVVDYGGGWNGPRSGGAGGYNDASYVNIAFGGVSSTAFTMHVQLVSGLAPNWGFLGAVGYGDLSTTDAVSFENALAPVAGDPIASTNDVWTDPATGDTHLLARTDSGSLAYFHRPKAGSWSAASFVLPATYRGRFVVSNDRLVLVYGPNAGNLAYRVAHAADRAAGVPVDWTTLAETEVELPAGFGNVLAIYPESPAYQTTTASGIHVAIVGSGAEWRVFHAAIEP